MILKHLFRLLLLAILFHPLNLRAQETLTIAAASNIQPVIEDLKTALLEKNILLQTVYGASGKLASQILEGAPFDLFIAADLETPSTLHKKGRAEKPVVYGSGRLVVWSREKPDGALTFMKESRIRKVAIASPDIAPYGAAAVAGLKALGLYENVKDKLVFGENLSQVNQYIDSGAVDAALTSLSSVLSPPLSGKGFWVEVPPGSCEPIRQAIVLLNHGRDHHPRAAGLFWNYFFSAGGKSVLKKYGYQLP